MAVGKGTSVDSEPTLRNEGAEIALPLDSNCKLLVELLLDGVLVSHP